MATNRYLAAALTAAAAVAGTVGGAVYQASTQSEARSAMGAGTSNVSLPGTGVVVAMAGDAGTLDAAGAADGAVVAVVGGVPTLTTPAAGASLPDAAGVADGAVLAQVGASQVWAAPTSPTVTVLRASDCTAEAGSESASISGSGVGSTFTLSAVAAPTPLRVYNASTATVSRIVCPLPAGAWAVDTELAVTAASGWNTNGARYLGIALRNAINGGAATALWGMSVNDSSGTVYSGNLLTGPNNGQSFSGSSAGTPAADRWFRLALRPLMPFIGITVGVGSAGARPALWSPLGGASPLPTASSASIVDTTSATAVVVWLQSFGGGSGTTSITGSLTIRVVSL